MSRSRNSEKSGGRSVENPGRPSGKLMGRKPQPKAWVALLATVVFAPSAAVPAAHSEDKQITVVFRYDDFSNRTPIEFDTKLIDAFRTRGMSATFAVIPFERQLLEGEPYYGPPKKLRPLTSEKAELLVAAIGDGTLEVALHGYVHQEIAPQRPWTEFAGLSAAEQRRKIAAGKELLEQRLETVIVTFVPPFNSYDQNTVRVLEEGGFRILSAGSLQAPGGVSPLKFLPSTCQLKDVCGAVKGARKVSETAPIIVVMCHPHDFLEISQERGMLSFQEFVGLLDWLASADDVRTSTLSEVVARSGRELDAAHYREYCALRPDKPNRLLPSVLGSRCANVCFYPTPRTLDGMKFTLWLRLVLIYGGITVAAFALGCLVLAVLPRMTAPAAYAASLALVGLVVYVGRNFEVYFLGAATIACTVGVCAAAWSRLPASRRRKTSRPAAGEEPQQAACAPESA